MDLPKFKNNFPQYLSISHNKKIFFNTNFNPDEKSDQSQFDLNRPTIILNYGLVCNFSHWIKQIPFLEENGFRIIIHHYRGHFSSTPMSEKELEEFKFSDVAFDIEEIRKFCGVKKCVMIGHSMGVNITLEYALKFGEYLNGIVLISGTVKPPEEIMFDSPLIEWLYPILKFFAKKYPQPFKQFWKHSAFIPILQKSILMGGFNPDEVSLEFVQQYLNRVKQLDPNLFFRLLDSMGEQILIHELPSLNMPTLVISGEKDKVVPNYLQETFKDKIKGSEFYLVKDGSHVPQVDFPNLVNERILAFLDTI